MNRVKFAVIIIFLILSVPRVHAQGCSDAGFCTLHGLQKPGGDSATTGPANSISVGASYGKGDFDVKVWGSYLEFHRSFPGGFSVGAKATFSSQAGPSLTTSGLSDLFLSAGFTGDGKTSFTAGLKIPLNDGNKIEDGLPLPMNYQTSLGTFDAIVGIGYRLEGLEVTAAVQQPISQNSNTFIATAYPAGSEFIAFPTTNEFRRKGDVLLRISYPLDAGGGWEVTPGLLPIYHLGDDEYTEVGLGGDVRKEIPGSGGLTVNGNLFLEYDFNGSSRVEFSFGGPFVARDIGPAGLKRGFVAGAEYTLSF